MVEKKSLSLQCFEDADLEMPMMAQVDEHSEPTAVSGFVPFVPKFKHDEVISSAWGDTTSTYRRWHSVVGRDNYLDYPNYPQVHEVALSTLGNADSAPRSWHGVVRPHYPLTQVHEVASSTLGKADSAPDRWHSVVRPPNPINHRMMYNYPQVHEYGMMSSFDLTSKTQELQKALRNLEIYEKDLTECLESVDLVGLARQAAECKLVPEKVVANLESLYPDESRQLVCRYLIYHVYQGTSSVQQLESWLNLLSQRVMSGLLSLMRKSLSSSEESTDERKLFTERHVPQLTEMLADCSSKWKEIGIALGIPDDKIKSIVAMIHIYDPVMCLNKVLSLWVACRSSVAKLPTSTKLEQALRSKTVGLGLEASVLKEKFQNLISESAPSSLKPNCSTQSPIISSQTRSKTIREGISVLLEVQVCGASDPFSFVWFKDGCKIDGSLPLVHHTYNYCHTSILFWETRNLLAEGVFFCEIQCNSAKVLVTDDISLTIATPVDRYHHILVNFYTEQPEVPEDTWPPETSNTYISLALIKLDSIHHAGEYGRLTIRGDADDIYKNKESLQYERAFSNLESGTRLLVEGRPGSGKTTLVHKISKDWATEVLALTCTRILILVHLRAFSSNPNIALCEILNCYFRDSSMKQEIMAYAEKHGGLGFCFILDGLDEYSPKRMQDTYIYKLIKKKALPKAIVIVASRPAAAADFRSVASRQVEVLGFLKEQISDYVDSYPFSNLQFEKRKNLKKYFIEHPNIHHMCYLPIHAAMVCFLFDCLEGDLPQTETEVYKEFTKFSILRILYRTKDPSEFYLNSIKDLPMPQKEVYSKICTLAFEMCKSLKQVMAHDEVKPILDSVHSDNISLSLVTVDRMAMRCGFKKTYTFLHLTFQEFLGAYHIASLSNEQQLKLIYEFGKVKEFQQVWKFYCGLASFEYKKFEILVGKSEHSNLFKIQCAFESQHSRICTIASDNDFLYVKDFLSPSNFAEIAFVLCNTSTSVPVLCFEECLFGEESAQVLTQKAGHILTVLCFEYCNLEQLRIINFFLRNLPSLQMLDINSKYYITKEMIETLTLGLSPVNIQTRKFGTSIYSSRGLPECLASCSSLVTNSLVFNCFSEMESSHGSKRLLTVYCHTNSSPHVNMSTIKLGLDGVKALTVDLAKHLFLSRLTLIDCGIDSEAASFLALGLKHCGNLEALELGFNCVGDVGAIDIARNIERYCNKLSLLDMVHNNLSDYSAFVVADVLKGRQLRIHLGFNSIINHDLDVDFHTVDASNKDLMGTCGELQSCHPNDIFQLNLSMNELTHSALELLCSVIKQCSNLQGLNLSSTGLDPKSARILSGTLRYCVNLQNLDISANRLTTTAIRDVVSSLKYCTNLLQLKINSNHMMCDGAKALAQAFTYWTNIYVLDISSNGIGSQGFRALADGLGNCVTLRELHASHNFLCNEDAHFLVKPLKCFTDFQVLDVSDNDLQVSGAQAIIDTLCHNTNLRVIDFRNNNIEVQQLMHSLGNCIKVNSS